MISEGSCDTEDWDNDVAITEIHDILKFIKIENVYNSISVLLCFSSNKYSFGKYETYFKSMKEIKSTPKHMYFWATLIAIFFLNE